MRAALAMVFVVAVASSSIAAERPQPPETFAPVVDAVRAAVLSVVHPHDPDADALEADDFLGRLFEALTRLPHQTLGAAVMIDPSGIAVTGANLLRGMTEVAVLDVHGRRFRATVMSRDERTDIALLRVVGGGSFPVVGFGDSDTVRIGDWVVAVGSPYGFEASVSAGIVSGRPRIAAGGPWGDVLQTDAAVNPGSAGGPLINARGEMIGLAAVPAPRGSGIGFAAASNVVRKVVGDLLAHGQVVRSWLGVESQPLTPALARAFHAPAAGGLVLTEIVPGGPAAQAGLLRGSIVLALEGHPLRTTADLEAMLARLPPGRTVTLEVWRDARLATVQATLVQEPGTKILFGRHRWLGLVLEGITPETGVVVATVEAGSPALAAGVVRGDVVRELDRRAIRTLTDFEEAAQQVPPGGPVTLLVQRGRTAFYLALPPER
jgi:serine protease Do